MADNFDALSHFATWFMQQPLAGLIPVEVYGYGPISSLVLYRQAPYQVELFIASPGAGFPEEHRHPHVDSYEVDLCGDIDLTVNGKRLEPICIPRDKENKLKPIRFTRVRNFDFHGAKVIPQGGAFLSIQHWLNGEVPTSVGLNWEGKPSSPEHALRLEQLSSKTDPFGNRLE